MKGINNPQEAVGVKGTNNTNVKGVNISDITDPPTALGSNNAASFEPKLNTSNVNAIPPIEKHTSNTSQAPNNGSIISNQTMPITYHKRKAKPHGKHYQPTPATPVVYRGLV